MSIESISRRHRTIQQKRFAVTQAQRQVPRAAAVIIGDEVLSGKTRDTNSTFLAQQLFKNGLDLVRVETITDNVEDIVETVRRLSDLVGPDGCVFTSGGIGCTHDDVTYEALATAFGRNLELHEDSAAKMRSYYASKNLTVKKVMLRMVTLPQSCRIIWTPPLWVPLVVLKNVYILPGVPSLFQQMLETAFSSGQLPRGPIITRRTIDVDCGEGDIATHLSELQEEFPSVAMGSYPRMVQKDVFVFRTQLCFSGRDEALVLSVRERMLQFVKHFNHEVRD